MWYSLLQPISDLIVVQELEPVLAALPQWRLEKALSYRQDVDRYTCAKAYLLLCEMLEKHYGIVRSGESDRTGRIGDIGRMYLSGERGRNSASHLPEFTYGPHGKPFLKGRPDIHFNFSHCRKAILCAIGDIPLGADVEECQYDEALCREIFSADERADIDGSADPARRFAELWTRKESCLKLLGTGLSGNLEDILPAAAREGIIFTTEFHENLGVVSTTACRQR